MSAGHKETIRRFVSEVVNAGNLDRIEEFFAPSIAGGVRSALQEFFTAFPDWEEDISALVEEGDVVVGYFTCSGTHQGEFMGIPPTGGRMERVPEVYFFRFERDQIVEMWGVEDTLGRLQQLGIERVPPPSRN